MTALDILLQLVANTYATQILETSSESEQEFNPKSWISGSKSTPKRDYKETCDKMTDREETSKKKWSVFSRSKTFERALFKRTRFLWKYKTRTYSEQTAIKESAVLFEDKTVFHKIPSILLNFPLKFLVNDIYENWSLDLAHVDELAKYNCNIKYILVAVDCLSRYLQVEPLKTKYTTKQQNLSKR